MNNPKTSRIKFSVKDYHFRPRWSFIFATLCLLAIFISLGFWQLHRAQEKTELQQLYNSRLEAQPIPLDQLPKDTDLRYYPITADGYYDNDHTLLLDNKMNQHRIGYEVITPFIIAQQKKRLLVNRGWIPATENRRQLPTITPVTDHQTIQGIVYISPGKPFTLGNTVETSAKWPLRIQALVIPDIAQALQQPVYPFIILLNPQAPNGFVRNWQPLTTSPQKHLGYAAQWFTFAGVLIIIFIALNIKRTRPRL